MRLWAANLQESNREGEGGVSQMAPQGSFRAVHSRQGLVEVGQVLLCGMEKEDGGSLATQ